MKLSRYKTEQIVKCFALDLTANKAAEVFKGEIEVYESYFGLSRIRGKRGTGAGQKIKVFGLLKRNGKVYIQIVPNCRFQNKNLYNELKKLLKIYSNFI